MKCVLMMPLTLIQPRAISSTQQRVGQQRLAEPAVLLGDHQPEDPHLLHALDDLRRVLVGVLELRGDRDDLLVDELADQLQQLDLVLGQPVGVLQSGHASDRHLASGWVCGSTGPVGGPQPSMPPGGADGQRPRV